MPTSDDIGARVDGVERIAVLRANGIGDFIVCLPALAALKSAYPAAELVLLGLSWHAGFLTGRPGPVDTVIAIPPVPGVTAAEHEPVPDNRMERFAEWIRSQRLDLAVQLHGGGRYSNPLVRSLGARVSVGLRSPDAEQLDRWVHYAHYQHDAMRFLEAVALVGAAPTGLDPHLPVTADDRCELARLGLDGKTDGGIVALHPGANDPRRRWPPDRFAAVGDAMAALGYQIFITGTAAEAELGAEVVGKMRRPAESLVDRLSLGGLGALYERCAVVIANDTGARHLAEAVGTSTVAVYWCGNLINAGPLFRARHRPLISWTTACPVCGVDCVRETADFARCDHRVSFVKDVPAGAVLAAVRELLSTG